MSSEDAVLFGGGEARIERDDLGLREAHSCQRLGRVTDLPLPREEHEDVMAAAFVGGCLGPEFLNGPADSGYLVDVATVVGRQRPIPHLDGVGAPGHLDNRRRPTVDREVFGEPLRVDGRRGDDHLEFGATRKQPLEVPENEVDVETALVRLVDNDRVVPAQVPIALHLVEEDAVGHHLDRRLGA